ncbi:hypothetical protein BE20_01390 [Sorangium cellulosum]|nr:hypothetical protein BE20_01390 [Sorangium cellulosum]
MALAACGEDVPGDDVASSEEELSRPASSAGASPSDVSALAPQPGLDLIVSPDRGELSASSFPALPTRVSSDAEVALSYTQAPADLSEGFGVGFSLSVPSIQMTTDWGVPYLSLGAERLMWVKTDTVSGKTRIEYRLVAGGRSTARRRTSPRGWPAHRRSPRRGGRSCSPAGARCTPWSRCCGPKGE